MKSIRFVSFFLIALICSISYANENKYIFVGQNENEGQTKTVFVLELLDNELESYALISEDGEVYLKVDKVVAVPKE